MATKEHERAQKAKELESTSQNADLTEPKLFAFFRGNSFAPTRSTPSFIGKILRISFVRIRNTTTILGQVSLERLTYP